jgi:hypothetical protein
MSRARESASFSPCATSSLVPTISKREKEGIPRTNSASAFRSAIKPVPMRRMTLIALAIRLFRDVGCDSCVSESEVEQANTYHMPEVGNEHGEHVKSSGCLRRAKDGAERRRELVLAGRERGEVVAEAGEPDDVERIPRPDEHGQDVPELVRLVEHDPRKVSNLARPERGVQRLALNAVRVALCDEQARAERLRECTLRMRRLLVDVCALEDVRDRSYVCREEAGTLQNV